MLRFSKETLSRREVCQDFLVPKGLIISYLSHGRMTYLMSEMQQLYMERNVIDESTKQKEKKESKKWSGKMKSEEKF